MNFEFSEDQQLIRDQAANFLREHCSTKVVRSILDSDKYYDKDLWRAVAELGWTAITTPEQYGGLGLGYLELCVTAEELGRKAAPIPFSSSVYLATEALLLAGNDDQKQLWLPQLASGQAIGTAAITEYQAPPCTFDPITHTISGQKITVADGCIADFYIVSAQETNGLSLFLVANDPATINRQTLATLDPSRPQAKIDFNQSFADRLGQAGNGSALLNKLEDNAAVLLAFEQIGGAQAALDMGIAYCKYRYAFGRQVASFQAIKHKYADMYVALELARSNAYYGAWALANNNHELPLAAATARVSASDAFYQVSKENIQAHGGMGFTWEFDCHLYYRRAQYLSSLIGSTVDWRQRLAQRLLASELSA